MKKFYILAFCAFSLLLSGCENKDENLTTVKKEESRKNIMGDGKLNMPKQGSNIGGL